ncbi:MAG: hypothetical protein ACPHXR_01835 [Flavicella sp.]
MYIAPKLIPNNVYSILMNDWDEEISGLFIAEGTHWILLHDNPSDFVVDGFRFVLKKNIDEIIEDEDTAFKNAVFNKKYTSLPKYDSHNLNGLDSVLKDFQDNEILLHFDTDDAEEIVVGKITSVTSDSFTIKTISQYAEWEGESKIGISEVSSIAISNDYLNSLSLFI